MQSSGKPLVAACKETEHVALIIRTRWVQTHPCPVSLSTRNPERTRARAHAHTHTHTIRSGRCKQDALFENKDTKQPRDQRGKQGERTLGTACGWSQRNWMS